MSRYIPVSERTTMVRLSGWQFGYDAIRFSGFDPRSQGGPVRQMVVQLDDAPDEEVYAFARSLLDYAIALERHISRVLDNSMQEEIPLP